VLRLPASSETAGTKGSSYASFAKKNRHDLVAVHARHLRVGVGSLAVHDLDVLLEGMMENLSAALKKYYLENDISLRVLAEKVGVSHTTFSNVMHGMVPRNERTRYKIEKFLRTKTEAA
jgi:DNA-binding XRE family transcriptional regulator